jgi:hypothetical protein
MERRELVRGTHFLERGEARTGQNMERKHASKRYLLPREGGLGMARA